MNLDFVGWISLLFLGYIIATVAVKRIRRALLLKRQRLELEKARERKSTAGTLRKIEADQAFERGDATEALKLLGPDKRDD